MKLLLTSNGLTNDTIRAGFVDLTGKPIEDTSVVYIPTAMHGLPEGGRYLGDSLTALIREKWRRVAILELAALPDLPKHYWLPIFEDADVIMVEGGNTPFLSYWFQKSGFAAMLPSLLEDRVYLGVSAGSIVVSDQLVVNKVRLRDTGVYADEQYGDVAPLGLGSDFTLRLVPVVIRPHLNAEYFERVSLADMKVATTEIRAPIYVIDDASALKVIDGRIEVISEGIWEMIHNATTMPLSFETADDDGEDVC